MNEPLISATDVHYSHEGGIPVLRGAEISIYAGELLVILGANGSGKSTLFRILAGSWKPQQGSVYIDGALAKYNRSGRDRVRRIVQMVLQEPDDQIFSTTVRGDVSYGPLNQGVENTKELVDAAMATVDISHLADRVPHQLSYGQRKRVTLAGALAMQPRVLLLDEPTAGLDPGAVEQLARTLGELCQEGTAIVLSTHDVDFAYACADRVGILRDGQLIMGDPELLMADEELMAASSLRRPWGAVLSEILKSNIRKLADLSNK